MIRLIVFDLDGTLIDSVRDLADATNALIRELGGAALAEEMVAGLVGDGARLLVQRALVAAGLDADTPGALDRFLALYDDRLLNHTKPYDGTLGMLQRLANHTRLAVLTNKPRSASTRILEGLGLLGFFQDVIGGDSPLGRKPDTRGLLALVSGAGTTPHATLLVGDSAVDLRTARSAGTRVCLARFGFGFNAAISDLREGEFAIDEPAELTRIVEMLGH